MAAEVVISELAEDDLRSIVLGIFADNPPAALRLEAALRKRCLDLEDYPERGEAVFGRIRRLVEGNYLIFYDVLAEAASARTVVILRVLHGARNLPPDLADG